ncbi:tumor necrosis factor-like [Nelusetta ayraudi]|uniref:tumor necrosis factor-like n=1 Tax=Nelusetta ayraudi TaxID=303726 RepID=UPI003F6FD315
MLLAAVQSDTTATQKEEESRAEVPQHQVNQRQTREHICTATMVEFTAAQSDVEMGMLPRRVVLVEKKSSSGRMWTMIGALFLLVLCFGGAVLFVWHLNGKEKATPQEGRLEALVNRIPSSASSEPTGHNNTLSSIGSSAKSAIHLEARQFSHEEDAEVRQLEWLSTQGQAFSQGGFELVENRIKIPESGLYFVYSQASYSVSCGADGSDAEATPLSHRIWRHADSMGGKVPLIGGVRSACQSAGGSEGGEAAGHGSYNTIYLGAVFKLIEGDTLWAETHPLSKVEKEEGKTFFGVFAL